MSIDIGRIYVISEDGENYLAVKDVAFGPCGEVDILTDDDKLVFTTVDILNDVLFRDPDSEFAKFEEKDLMTSSFQRSKIKNDSYWTLFRCNQNNRKDRIQDVWRRGTLIFVTTNYLLEIATKIIFDSSEKITLLDNDGEKYYTTEKDLDDPGHYIPFNVKLDSPHIFII